MQYWIILKKGKFGHYHYIESLLPGVVFPARLLPKMRADFADDVLDLCKHCDMDCHCHPIGAEGEKYCTILFHDVVKPAWSLSDVM